MHKQFTIFSQLIKLFPRYKFNRIVDRYNGDHNTRSLTCWTQFTALLFAQFTGRKSLRDLVANFNSHTARLYHLGCKSIAKSSLADANNNRNSQIYMDVFHQVLELTKTKTNYNEAVQLIDSTSIFVNKKFKWALGTSNKNALKLHFVYDPEQAKPVYFTVTNARKNDLVEARELAITSGTTYVFDRGYYGFTWWNKLDKKGAKFVTRLKINSTITVTEERKAIGNEEFEVLSDCKVKLNHRLSYTRKNPYNHEVRVIKVKLKGYSNNQAITLVCNDFKSTAIKICELYKKRWQIELFFKWIKQNLKIKTFLGTSENAVKTQVIVAMIAYLLSQYLLVRNQLGISLQRFCQIIQTNLMEYKFFKDLLKPPIFQTQSNTTPQLRLAI